MSRTSAYMSRVIDNLHDKRILMLSDRIYIWLFADYLENKLEKSGLDKCITTTDYYHRITTNCGTYLHIREIVSETYLEALYGECMDYDMIIYDFKSDRLRMICEMLILQHSKIPSKVDLCQILKS